MKKQMGMRRIIPALALAFVPLLTGCSYSTAFVVVNASDQPAEIRYKVRPSFGTFKPPEPPITTAASQIHAAGKPWRHLLADEYAPDPENRTVTVRVKPKEALLVERVQRGGMQVDEDEEATDFMIEELTITGAFGEIKLQGYQVRKSFVAESKKYLP
ncbi:MAG TPA: hypothetical protein VFD58_06190 [Blastocatellia bacterium]|nr:hypothetical protein [Blastocatellia bacterium]